MPATRRSTRHAAQSPPSHSSLLPSSLHTGVPTTREPEPESWASASTATLPARYTIALALPADASPLPLECAGAEYVRGEEALNDAWRRKEEHEGRLADVRVRLRRCVRHGGDHDIGASTQPEETVDESDDAARPLWYTAGLVYACTCQLVRISRVYSPAFPPPTLDVLQPLSPLTSRATVPLVHDDLPDWSTDLGADLDAVQDELEEFVTCWKGADGSGWGAQGSCEDLELGIMPMPTTDANTEKSADARRIHKGKFRATDHEDGDTPDALAAGENDVGAESWKARRERWRILINSDTSYGKIWTILPRPHRLDSPPPRRQKPPAPTPPPPPDYVLPRFLLPASSASAVVHPYHPDLPNYIRCNPAARVYWLIPLHGPVLIPSLQPVTTHDTEQVKEAKHSRWEIPAPSIGQLADTLPTPAITKTRPAPLVWTAASLRYLWQAFLEPLVSHSPASPFGRLAVRLSGPKPDPFIALLPPPRLDQHVHVPPGHASRGQDIDGADEGAESRPESVEAGDHLRIYVDARRALALRTWLHGIEVDLGAVPSSKSDKADKADLVLAIQGGGGGLLNQEGAASDVANQGGGGAGLPDQEGSSRNLVEKDETWRPFHKVRLCLVGERGEVLVVA